MTEALVLTDLLAGGWRDCRFEPFRDGVEICHLLQGEPSAALLRYAAGASIPPHRHAGLETVLVLEGSQRDHRGTYRAGTLVLNLKDSEHAVVSDDGCVVLVQWQRPVSFIGTTD